MILATEFDSIVNGDSLSSTLHSALSSLRSTYRSRTKEKKSEIPQVLITEILHRSDPRLQSEKAEEARQKEIENLVRRGTLELNLEEDVPPGANVISGSFVVTIKGVETANHIFKARFLVH